MVDSNTVMFGLAAASAVSGTVGLIGIANAAFSQRENPVMREKVARAIFKLGLWGNVKGAAEALKYPESFIAEVMADEKFQPKDGSAE